jgi:light-regulated signal transduction histidine kinase (bacteriophytochrome)
MQTGALDYILKPFKVSVVLLVLSRALEVRRLRLENALLQRRERERVAELEATNKELDAFCYSVSHDLRAPVRRIDGFIDILLQDFASQLAPEARQHLERIATSAQHMAQLIDDMLNLSRVTRSDMYRGTVDLSARVRSIVGELQRTEPERPVEWVIAEGLVAEGDARLLWIVLENLLGNAWKFTGKRERARIEFGVLHQEGCPAYYVRDNGAGFDMAFADKLFGAFQRLHAITEFTGTGIGLATVQRIVHRHGGRVWAEGAVDQGATFYFTL